MSWTVGLDLGQAADYTALAAVERTVRTPTVVCLSEPRKPPPPPVYAVRLLHRWPLGTPYTAVADDVRALTTGPLAGCQVAVDETGVGRPVVDMLRRSGLGGVRPVCITSGHEVTPSDSGGFHCPKKVLVTTLQLLLQSRRLTVAKALPEAAVLVKEMQAFRVKITAAANEVYESWRERDHDDLLLAVALAVWLAERSGDGTIGYGGRLIDDLMPGGVGGARYPGCSI